MTDEQIKQRAERYASENYHPYGSETNPQYLTVSEDSFIAGAHSRDEEIEKMQEELNHLRKALSTNKFDDVHGDILTAYGLLVLDYDKRGSYLQDLEKELDKFRNL